MQELEESAYWLDLLQDIEIFSKDLLAPLRQETEALIAIFVTIVRKVKNKAG